MTGCIKSKYPVNFLSTQELSLDSKLLKMSMKLEPSSKSISMPLENSSNSPGKMVPFEDLQNAPVDQGLLNDAFRQLPSSNNSLVTVPGAPLKKIPYKNVHSKKKFSNLCQI